MTYYELIILLQVFPHKLMILLQVFTHKLMILLQVFPERTTLHRGLRVLGLLQ